MYWDPRLEHELILSPQLRCHLSQILTHQLSFINIMKKKKSQRGIEFFLEGFEFHYNILTKIF